MHCLDLDPVALIRHAHLLPFLGCTEVTLSRPISFHIIGRPPCLFVADEDGNWASIGDHGLTDEVLDGPRTSASRILSIRFPGVTFHERFPDGGLRTLVDCRPPSVKANGDGPSIKFETGGLRPKFEEGPDPVMPPDWKSDTDLNPFLGGDQDDEAEEDTVVVEVSPVRKEELVDQEF